MTETETIEGTRAELFSRSTLPRAAASRRDAIADRLRRLAADGHVSTVAFDSWTGKVPIDASAPERDRYERFDDWADEVGVALDPFFETRECYSTTDGSRGTFLVLPALCLALYRDDRLQTVYPHSTPTGARSVMDGLNAIETVRTDPRDFAPDDGERERLEAAD
jgi:hypothetical protein